MAMALILLLGLVLRLINLNQSLWLDEAVQAITSQGSFGGIFTELQGDFHPPLYHLLMWAWVHLFGSSEIVLRLPSVLFGVGTIWVVYKIGEIGGIRERKRLGQVAALLTAIAPYHIYYSQEARMYAMTAFFASLSMYWFLRVIGENKGKKGKRVKMDKKGERRIVLGYLAATAAMLYSDYYGFLVLLAQAIAVLIIFRKRSAVLLSYCLAALLLFLPWLPFLLIQLKTGLQATSDFPNWANLVNLSFAKAIPLTFVKFTIGRITIFDKRLYALVALGIFGVFGGVGIRGLRGKRGIRRTRREKMFVEVILLWLVVPILVAWLASLFIPNYQPFRLLLVLPAFYLLLAIGVMSIKNSKLTFLALFFILFTFHFSLFTYFTNSYFHREDWRGMVRFLQGQEESVAILPSETSNWPLRYYDPEGKIKLVAIGKGVREIREMREMGEMGDKKVFYIRYLVPIFDPYELIDQKLSELGYDKIREVSFNQIPIWIYAHRD